MKASNKSLLTFLFGLGSLTQIRIVGAMGITEFVCIVAAPFVLISQWPNMRRTLIRPLLMLAAAWFFSAIITDFWWRDTYWIPAIKGSMAIAFMVAGTICAYGLLKDDLLRVRWYALGAFVSAILSMFIFRPQYLISYAEVLQTTAEELTNFKSTYVIIYLTGMRAFVAFIAEKTPVLAAAVTLGIALMSLLNGSRSVFLIYAICAFIILIAYRRVRFFHALQRQFFVAATCAILALNAATSTYEFMAEKGWMGQSEYEKMLIQKESDIGYLSGRGEFIGGFFAALDSPLLGHGSWAIDETGKYYFQVAEVVGDETGLNRLQNTRRFRYIPCHSHVIQAWVWHGFAGALFWIVILVWIVRYLRTGVQIPHTLTGYNILISITLIWNVFFSGFSNRLGWAIFFVTMALTMDEVARRRRLHVSIYAPWDGKPVLNNFQTQGFNFEQALEETGDIQGPR